MTAPGDAVPSTHDGGATLFCWLRRMRDQRPVYRDARGVWHVFRYADVRQVIVDPAVFSSDQSRVMAGAARWTEGNLNSIDPPEHGNLRRVVSTAFTPAIVASLAPRIAQVCAELLDRVPGDDGWDLSEMVARPLPVIVIAQLLGIPDSDHEMFRGWSDRLLTTRLDYQRPSVTVETYERVTADLNAYLTAHCQDRRRHPRTDLITALVSAESDGRHLSDTEVVNFAGLLLMAGHLSTTALLGNTFVCLRDNPDADANLRADRTVLPGLIEEVLRYRPPFMMLGRFTATRDAILAGQHVPEGSVVTPWLLSANHDERQFADPERFDYRRSPGAHLAFGYGPHFCLGAALARLEARTALSSLLDRFPAIRVTPGTQMRFSGYSIFAPDNVPVTVRKE